MKNFVMKRFVTSFLILMVDRSLSLSPEINAGPRSTEPAVIEPTTVTQTSDAGGGIGDDSMVDDQRQYNTKIFQETTAISLSEAEPTDNDASQRKHSKQNKVIGRRPKSTGTADKNKVFDTQALKMVQKKKVGKSEMYIQILFVSVTIAFLAAAALGLLYITYFMLSGFRKPRESKIEKDKTVDDSRLSEVFSVIPSDSDIWREMKKNPEL